MPAVPADIPDTMPVEPTVAMSVAPLVHTPPVVVQLSAVVCPAHKPIVPVIGAGLALTVIIFVVVHPVPNE